MLILQVPYNTIAAVIIAGCTTLFEYKMLVYLAKVMKSVPHLLVCATYSSDLSCSVHRQQACMCLCSADMPISAAYCRQEMSAA